MKTLLTRCFALAALAACVQGCCSTRTPAEAKPVSVELVRSGRSWDGAILPPYPADPPELRILRIAIPAGARLPDHRHPVINAGVLTRGSLNVVAENGQTLELKAGDPIIDDFVAPARPEILRNAALLGAAVLAAQDTEGRPSLSWRADHAAKVTEKKASALGADMGRSAQKAADRAEKRARQLAKKARKSARSLSRKIEATVS